MSTRGPRPPLTPAKMFETHSHAWREAGLLQQITPAKVRRARREALVLLAIFAGVIVVYLERRELFGRHGEEAVHIGAVVMILALGWWIARDLGRALVPRLLRRLEPGTAGTVGFLIRLATVIAVIIVALAVALEGKEEVLAYGGAFTAVISIVFGLAAQQTIGNFFAGTVLITARPFRVGERVRLQGGPLAGQLEGVVSSQGLLYTTFATGEDSIMVPNSVVLSVAVRPLREPDAVTLRARLAAGMTPSDLQELLEGALETPLRGSPRITLEELDGTQAVVQIVATPQRASDGRHLASELLALVPAQRPRAEGGGEGGDGRDSRAGRESGDGGGPGGEHAANGGDGALGDPPPATGAGAAPAPRGGSRPAPQAGSTIVEGPRPSGEGVAQEEV